MLKINPIFHEETSVSELRNHANNAMNKIIVIDDNTYLITGCNIDF